MAAAASKRTFLFFAYGSNLLRERIHICNPSAVFKATAKLEDFQLGFKWSSSRWGGSVATIQQAPSEHVWGVVWELDMEHMQSLDEQEGVPHGLYKPLEVIVTCGATDERLTCRTYQFIYPCDMKEPKPSPKYKEVIVSGAIQNGLPEEYIEQLKTIADNGYSGKVDVCLCIN